jgi:hypothetical protein
MKLTDKDRQVIKERLKIAADSIAAVYCDLGPPKKRSINVANCRRASASGLRSCARSNWQGHLLGDCSRL